MELLIHEIRRNPLLWLLVAVPFALMAGRFKPDAPILLFR